jgi:hypothetical protein
MHAATVLRGPKPSPEEEAERCGQECRAHDRFDEANAPDCQAGSAVVKQVIVTGAAPRSAEAGRAIVVRGGARGLLPGELARPGASKPVTLMPFTSTRKRDGAPHRCREGREFGRPCPAGLDVDEERPGR